MKSMRFFCAYVCVRVYVHVRVCVFGKEKWFSVGVSLASPKNQNVRLVLGFS